LPLGSKIEISGPVRTAGNKSWRMNLGAFYKELILATQISVSSDKIRKQLSKNLEKIRDDQQLSTAQLLILDWAISLTKLDASRPVGQNQAYAAKTAQKYVRKLTNRFIQCVGDQDVERFSDEEWLDVFEAMMSVNKSLAEDNENLLPFLTKAFLAHLHRCQFAKRLDLPSLEKLNLVMPKYGADVTHISARITSVHHVTNVANFLLGHAVHGDQFALILVLFFRCGLRISEVLRLTLEDIEYGYLTVRKNLHGIRKTEAGKRTLDLNALLSAKELTLLNRRLDVLSSKELIFSPSPHMAWDSGVIRKLIINLLRQSTVDPELVLHHLRHSAANIFHLVIEDSFELAGKLSGFG
jgi:integrase